MRHILWIDLEVADYKSDRQGSIHQLAYILDIDGLPVAEGDIRMAPMKGDLINAPSLEFCGVDYETIKAYPPAVEGWKKLVNVIHPHKRIAIGGFNAQSFDFPLIIDWWYRCQKELSRYNIKWVDYLYPDVIDVRAIAMDALLEERSSMKGFKLTDVATHLGISAEGAHDAVNDIRMTRDIYYKLKNRK